MGFRFRRSVKILPGIKLNLSSRGHSWTIGGKYSHTTINKGRGTVTHSVRTPIPGLSYVKTSHINTGSAGGGSGSGSGGNSGSSTPPGRRPGCSKPTVLWCISSCLLIVACRNGLHLSSLLFGIAGVACMPLAPISDLWARAPDFMQRFKWVPVLLVFAVASCMPGNITQGAREQEAVSAAESSASSEAPASSSEPAAVPGLTVVPEATATPGPTVSPEPTAAPAPTASLEPTATPEPAAAAAPENTVAPKPTAAPASSAASASTQDDGLTYYWTPNGKSYHSTPHCPTLSRSKNICSGTLAEAKAAGKTDPCDKCM